MSHHEASVLIFAGILFLFFSFLLVMCYSSGWQEGYKAAKKGEERRKKDRRKR